MLYEGFSIFPVRVFYLKYTTRPALPTPLRAIQLDVNPHPRSLLISLIQNFLLLILPGHKSKSHEKFSSSSFPLFGRSLLCYILFRPSSTPKKPFSFPTAMRL